MFLDGKKLICSSDLYAIVWRVVFDSQ